MRLVKPEQYKESVFQGIPPLQFCYRVGLVKQSSTPCQEPLHGTQESSSGIASTNDGKPPYMMHSWRVGILTCCKRSKFPRH